MVSYNKFIDHTLLKPNATDKQIIELCKEAIKYDFKSVCINPSFIKLAKEVLHNSNVLICTVIGFPLGAMTTKAKVYEAKDAIALGADEIDMVLNISDLKQKKISNIIDEIRQVKSVCKNKTLKVIIETCLLTKQEKINACKAVSQAGANFIKTSTGFSIGGATVEDVKLLKKYVKDNVKVKASGGINNSDEMISMIKAGAERIGTSKGVILIKGLK